MAYYDIFLAPVPESTRQDYAAFLKESHAMMVRLGATEVVDLWGDDVPEGKLTSFPLAVQLKEGEAVAAGWVIWPSKEVRDAGWGRMMSEEQDMKMPFDGKRMIFAGFSEMLVSRA
ncbi:MAG: DUF1428 domain-containing protein [Sulfitobacter sp.]|nr:DUF1428 domain-containing protein [Sulfitobacter sp.]